MRVGIGSLAVKRGATGVDGLGGAYFNCSNYGMWRKALPYRMWFCVPYRVLDTLRSNVCNRHCLGTAPVRYVQYGII